MGVLIIQFAKIAYYADIFHVHLQFAFRVVLLQFYNILTIGDTSMSRYMIGVKNVNWKSGHTQA